MAVRQAQITVPSNGTPTVISSGLVTNSNQVNIRNTGAVDVLIGPADTLAPPLNVVAAAIGSGGSFAAGTYFWVVTALNAYGETQGSVETGAAIITNGSCHLTWNAVVGASTYKVYRSTTSGGEGTSPAFIASSAVTNYTDTGIAPTSGAVPVSNTAQVALLFPLHANDYLGYEAVSDDDLSAQVATPGVAGQITILTFG